MVGSKLRAIHGNQITIATHSAAYRITLSDDQVVGVTCPSGGHHGARVRVSAGILDLWGLDVLASLSSRCGRTRVGLARRSIAPPRGTASTPVRCGAVVFERLKRDPDRLADVWRRHRCYEELAAFYGLGA